MNLLYGLGGAVDFPMIEREVEQRGLQEPWTAVQLRWREVLAEKKAAKEKRPAG